MLVNCTVVLPLSQSWNSSEVRMSIIQKPPQPVYNFQSLWYDGGSNRIFTFGGEQSWLDPKSPVELSTWRLALDGNGEGVWRKNATFQEPPFSQGIMRPVGGASVTDGKTAIYADGYSSSKSSPMTQGLRDFIPTPGIVTYDFNSGVWSNTTNTGNSRTNEVFLWGGMESVPFGPHGLVVMFGGESSEPQKYTPGAHQRSMSNITLFDPVTKLWYEQTATGAGNRMPSSRIQFCTTGVMDPTQLKDNTSSYEMLVSRDKSTVALNLYHEQIWYSRTREGLIEDSDLCIPATTVPLGREPRYMMRCGVS